MDINQTDIQKKLGLAIQGKRKGLGYSQESFADLCGVHRTYMGAIERGERNVSLLNLYKIAQAFQISLSKLFNLAGL